MNTNVEKPINLIDESSLSDGSLGNAPLAVQPFAAFTGGQSLPSGEEISEEEEEETSSDDEEEESYEEEDEESSDEEEESSDEYSSNEDSEEDDSEEDDSEEDDSEEDDSEEDDSSSSDADRPGPSKRQKIAPRKAPATTMNNNFHSNRQKVTPRKALATTTMNNNVEEPINLVNENSLSDGNAPLVVQMLAAAGGQSLEERSDEDSEEESSSDDSEEENSEEEEDEEETSSDDDSSNKHNSEQEDNSEEDDSEEDDSSSSDADRPGPSKRQKVAPRKAPATTTTTATAPSIDTLTSIQKSALESERSVFNRVFTVAATDAVADGVALGRHLPASNEFGPKSQLSFAQKSLYELVETFDLTVLQIAAYFGVPTKHQARNTAAAEGKHIHQSGTGGSKKGKELVVGPRPSQAQYDLLCSLMEDFQGQMDASGKRVSRRQAAMMAKEADDSLNAFDHQSLEYYFAYGLSERPRSDPQLVSL